MALLSLPSELRCHIYSYVSDLRTRHHVAVAPHVRVLPPICQVSRQVRHETIPLFARNSHFDVLYYDTPDLSFWMQALGPAGLENVQSVQLSRHWKIVRPSQGQGHVGFYVRLHFDRHTSTWDCKTGTYPQFRDRVVLRIDSAELLRRVIVEYLSVAARRGEGCLKFTAREITFVTAAMDIVASHPFTLETFAPHVEGSSHCMQLWSSMERKLLDLDSSLGEFRSDVMPGVSW